MHIVQEPQPDESFPTEKTGLRLREVWTTACSNTLGRNGIQMSMKGQERVAEDRAAVLLGLTMTEIRSFSRISDRKSTRLNSSHDQISYAVFCLKKKKNCAYVTVSKY